MGLVWNKGIQSPYCIPTYYTPLFPTDPPVSPGVKSYQRFRRRSQERPGNLLYHQIMGWLTKLYVYIHKIQRGFGCSQCPLHVKSVLQGPWLGTRLDSARSDCTKPGSLSGVGRDRDAAINPLPLIVHPPPF